MNGIRSAVFHDPKYFGLKGWHHFAFNADIDAALELIAEDGQWSAQLAAADTIECVSADTGDTTQTITVYGINTSDQRVATSGTLNGTTAIELTGFKYVENAFLSAECVGEITVRRKTGPATILQITVGQLQSYVCHHFNGHRDSYLTYFSAQADDNAVDSVIFELRWYPDDADSLDPGDGYSVLSRLTSVIPTPASAYAVGIPAPFVPPQPIKLPAGGYLAVYAIGAAANQTGSATIMGFDLE